MVLGGVIFFLFGIAAGILAARGSSLMLAGELLELRERFEPRPGVSDSAYSALFRHAEETHRRLVREKGDHLTAVGGAATTFGTMLILWAVDRRRLLKRLPRDAQPVGQALP